MKEYNKDFDIDFSPMSDETMSWLDELLMTCKRFHVDYYNASEKLWLEASTQQRKARIYRCAVLWHSSCRLNTSGSTAADNAPPNPQTIRSGDFLLSFASPR